MTPKKQTIAICGIGYVGFPVAMLFADTGFNVIGVDIDKNRVASINEGMNPIEGKEPGLDKLVKKVHKAGKFLATTDPEEYSKANYIIVAVQTPVGEKNKIPAYTNLKSALKSIGRNMKKGVLVIIESTIAPGTIENVVKPVLEKSSGMKITKDFLLANCPERLMPGYLLENIREYNRVVGGYSTQAASKTQKLYKHIVRGKLDKTDCITAEIVKTGENTYRDVQIAFANEMALLCEALGANVWKVRELINDCRKAKDTNPAAMRQMHYPGAGVGGHCIPKDSWLLISNVKDSVNPKLIPNARAINDFMPTHMFNLLKLAVKDAGKNLQNIKVAVLGYAYINDCDDDRNTPTITLLEHLHNEKVKSIVHDPYIKKFQNDLDVILKDVDAIILMTAHDEYKEMTYKKLKALMSSENPIIIDGRNLFDKEKSVKNGFIYKGVGNV